MDQNIPHSGNIPPGNARELNPKIFWNMFDRFSNNFYCPYYGKYRFIIL